MTQKYYTEIILPHYLKSIEESRAHGRKSILQEDNDPSHGTRSLNNLAVRFKREHNLGSFIHPCSISRSKSYRGLLEHSKATTQARELGEY